MRVRRRRVGPGVTGAFGVRLLLTGSTGIAVRVSVGLSCHLDVSRFWHIPCGALAKLNDRDGVEHSSSDAFCAVLARSTKNVSRAVTFWVAVRPDGTCDDDDQK